MRVLLVRSCCLLILLVASSASGVAIDWVPIGAAGNAADTQVMTCCGSSTGTSGYGAVSYDYFIGKYEVTNAQYAEFLNAVARIDDPHRLYNPTMTSGGYGGIARSGTVGNYSYAAISGRENLPVVYVDVYDAMRFSNWLQNGQPNTGAQTNGTTENGSYTFSGTYVVGPRNSGATIFLSSENEWYKAAYYDSLTASYFDFATGTNTQPTCASPTASPNRANCGGSGTGDLVSVGSYPGSPSPFGTFDQAGNVQEWLENGVHRGGDFILVGSEMAASVRYSDGDPKAEPVMGFRPVLVPEPDTAFLVIVGVVGLASWRRVGR